MSADKLEKILGKGSCSEIWDNSIEFNTIKVAEREREGGGERRGGNNNNNKEIWKEPNQTILTNKIKCPGIFRTT